MLPYLFVMFICHVIVGHVTITMLKWWMDEDKVNIDTAHTYNANYTIVGGDLNPGISRHNTHILLAYLSL